MSANKKNQRGQAALPTVLLIGGIITEIAIAGTLIAFVLSNSGLGERLSAQAWAAAQAGLQDAFLRIDTNKSFSSSGYSFSVGTRSVQVVVSKDPVGYPVGTDLITALGTALTRQRQLQAILEVDSTTGLLTLKSITEI